MAHDQPTYASVPGIRVFGMMCVKPVSYGTTFVRRPLTPSPPKRNQHFQPQSSYYQRYKKHATVKPSAQSKTEASQSELTTRGMESREGDDIDLDEFTEDRTSTLEATAAFDNSSPTALPILPTTDGESSAEPMSTVAEGDTDTTEYTTDETQHNRRIRRMIEALSDSSNRFDVDSADGENNSEEKLNRRRRRNADNWPDIPWDEVSEQIKSIQWD